jgi:hypothetical protein
VYVLVIQLVYKRVQQGLEMSEIPNRLMTQLDDEPSLK